MSIVFLLLMGMSCAPAVFKSKWTKEKAPETYVARFETSKGEFDIEVKREWSPHAADRFYQLVKHKYFDKGVFYRVVPNFVAQFGTSDSLAKRAWNAKKIPDEKVLLGNAKGTLSFARGGKATRTTDLYINLTDNARLDTINYNGVIGFPAFGKIIRGMDIASRLFSGYENKPGSKLDLLFTDPKKFYETYPNLDSIKKAYLLTP